CGKASFCRSRWARPDQPFPQGSTETKRQRKSIACRTACGCRRKKSSKLQASRRRRVGVCGGRAPSRESGNLGRWSLSCDFSMMYHVLSKSVSLARYFVPVAILAFVPLATPFAGDYFPPPDAKGGWRTLTDPAKIAKTAGVDRQKLDEAFDYVQNTS